MSRNARRAAAATTAALVFLAAGCGGDGSGDGDADRARAADGDRSGVTTGEAASEAAAPEGGASDPAPAGDAGPDGTFEVEYRDGAVVGGPQAFRVGSGDVVRISITSDRAEEVHVHGVDVNAELPAGATTPVTFDVVDRGSYEVELHESGILLGTLEVR